MDGDALEIHGTRIRACGASTPRAASFAGTTIASNTDAVRKSETNWQRSPEGSQCRALG
jgi:hypothetical protein